MLILHFQPYTNHKSRKDKNEIPEEISIIIEKQKKDCRLLTKYIYIHIMILQMYEFILFCMNLSIFMNVCVCIEPFKALEFIYYSLDFFLATLIIPVEFYFTLS